MKLRSILSLIFGLLLAASLFAQNSPLSTIDPPGSVVTRAFGINPKGQIVGLYITADNVTHGFLLSQGKYTTIDAPDSIRTNALSINPQGQIAGRYDTTDGKRVVQHGYILTNGSFETIDHPEAAGFTVITDITPAGDIAGRFQDKDGRSHGFTRINGEWTTIDHLDANGNPDEGPLGIQAMAVNPAGVVAGYYQDMNKVFHAFTLDHGVYTTIDPPDAISTGGAGGVVHINPEGDAVGSFIRAGMSMSMACAFVYRDGAWTTFAFPDGSNPDGTVRNALATGLGGINPQGDVVGRYVDHHNVEHGFFVAHQQLDRLAMPPL